MLCVKISILALLGASLASAQGAGGMPGGIPKGMVTELNERNFVKTVQSTPISLVSFFSGNPAEANYEAHLMQQLEVTAGHLMQSGITNVKIMSVQSAKNPNLVKQLGIQPEARPIMLFRSNSMPQEYFGQRTADSLAQFINELSMAKPVKELSTKAQKKKYEEFAYAKVIAYVEPGSSTEKWFKKAGEHFAPLIPFYQVTDKKIAKSLRLKKPGTGLFVRPYEKAIPIPSNVTNERAMIQFVYTNRKQALMKVRMVEIHLTWSGILSPHLFLGVLKPSSESGSKLLSTLKTVGKHFASNRSLHVAWVDSDSDVKQMLPQWAKTFEQDFLSSSATFGFINMAQNKHAWLDLSEPGMLTNPKKAIQWVSDALGGQVETKATQSGEQQAAPGPEADTEDEENFDLDIPEEGGDDEEDGTKTEL